VHAVVARAGHGGHPAVIQDIAYAGYLVDTKAPEGPYFGVAIIHHTACGSTLLTDSLTWPAAARRPALR
jgi:carbonic anhydrase